MRFDRVAIPLAPRTTSNCLDLAICFVRQHLSPIGGLWASIALPACSLTYFLVDRYEFTMSLAIVVFFFATSPLGVILMWGAAPCAFGEPFTFGGTWARLGWRGFGLLARGLGLRILIGMGSLFFLFPGWFLALRTSFFVEQATLSRMARHLHDRRTDELLKGEIGDLYVRSAGIFCFCSLLWLVLLIAADFLLKHLLGFPLLLGRLGVDLAYLKDGEDAGYVTSFLWGDPVVVTSALAVALLVYPLGRLAWFFVYVDVRVRRDCWDMELQILQEAERLGAA